MADKVQFVTQAPTTSEETVKAKCETCSDDNLIELSDVESHVQEKHDGAYFTVSTGNW